MANNNLNQRDQGEGFHSNIIFGTSSDSIEQGLHNSQFIEEGSANPGIGIDDENMIVNAQEQNEVVNASDEKFNEAALTESSSEEKNLVIKHGDKINPSLENKDKQDDATNPIVSKEK